MNDQDSPPVSLAQAQQQHPFGREEEVSGEQLFVSFCNNLYLGQWELTRACAQRLALQDGEIRTPGSYNILKVLKAVVRHPYHSIGSESIPSPSILTWLSLQLHEDLQNEGEKDAPLSDVEKKQVEFSVLLYTASIDRHISEDIIQEIYELYSLVHTSKYRSSSPSTLSIRSLELPALSQQTQIFLKCLLKEDPILGHNILENLKDCRPKALKSPHNQGLQQLYIDCIYSAFADLNSSDASATVVQDSIKQIYNMLSHLDPPSEMTKLPLNTLFNDLIRVMQDKPNTLAIHDIYSSLMGRSTKFLINEFCKWQEKLHRQSLDNLLGTKSTKLNMMCQDVRITLRLSEMKDREQAWKGMFFQSVSGGQHALENIVETFLTFIREGMFEELNMLMSPEEFHPLKPLVLLLGWDYVNSCSAATNLLESLFSMNEQSSNDPLLEQACNKLAYEVHLVKWCLEKARPLMLASGLDPSIDPKAGEIFHGLDSHSVLRVLHQSTHLSQLDPTEVFDMLSKRPQLEIKQSGSQALKEEKEKSVRFIEEPQRVSIQQERDITIYRSFLAMKLFMDALEYCVCQDNGWPDKPITHAKEMPLSEDNQNSTGKTGQWTNLDTLWDIHVTQKLHAAKYHLSELYPLTYRVETLENMFSLLFVRHEHFQSEGTGAQSDSGGEEGLVDEDWQNKSCTSLESVEISISRLEDVSQQQSTKEVTFHQTTVKSTGVSSNDGQEHFQGGKAKNVEGMSTERLRHLAVGILRRSSGLHNNCSSEASQYSNNSVSLPGKVGFVANEHFTQDVISILKECMLDLTTAKFTLLGTSTGKSDAPQAPGKGEHTAGEMTKYMKCAVKPSALAPRIAKLAQHINEAWWRFQLVSQNKPNARVASVTESKAIHEYSSDEEWRSFIRDSDEEDKEEGSERRKKRKKKHENRSRSASGQFSSDPMHSALLSPSTEMTSTEGTSSGNEKRRKQRRRNRNRRDEKLNWTDNSFIARMLSTKDTLLRMCLRRHSYTQAQQVIKMFEMEEKLEVSEVIFAEFWENAVRRIQAADERMKAKSTLLTQSKIKSGKSSSIANIAAAGVASSSVTSVVDDLLMTSSLPVLPRATQVSEKETDSLSIVDLLQNLEDKHVPAMVVFDLASTWCKTWQSSRDLLEVAKGRLNAQSGPAELVSRQRSATAPTGKSPKLDNAQALLGVVPFIHQMHSLVTLSTSECNIRQDVLKENYQYSVKDALLNASHPLDVTSLCVQISNTLDLKKATASLSRALKTHHAGFLLSIDPIARTSSSDSSGSGTSERSSRTIADDVPASSLAKSRQTSLVLQSTRLLLQVVDKIALTSYTVYALPQERGKKKTREMANYMLSLYNHVNVLASLLLEAKDWHPGLNRPVHSGNLKSPNPFGILDESPSLLLGRLMFQNQIPPIRLEGVANQLKLNLVHIIVQSCCPCITIQPILVQNTLPVLPPLTSRSQLKPVTSQSLQKVLNDSGDWTEPARHPEPVARELLRRVITLMKTFTKEKLTPNLKNYHIGQVENYTSSKICDMTGIVLAVSCQEYVDIVSATRELAEVDLNRLTKQGEKLCFFTNVLNLLLVHGAMNDIYTQLTQEEIAMTPSHTRHRSLAPHFDFAALDLTESPVCSQLVLERLGYLSKICYRIGQLGVISAFELQYIFLRSELPPPSTFGQILQHRIHDIGEDDPWYEYLPPLETRLPFVISNGCISSPVLQVLKVEDFDEQLSVAMQQYLENNVIVDQEKNVVSIPEYLDWFRKDFTGKSLPIDIQDGHIYGGLLNVVIPHVSQHLGEQLESLVLSCSPGKIQLERSLDADKENKTGTIIGRPLRKTHSFHFTVRIQRYMYDFAYKFKYQLPTEVGSVVHDLHRSSSNPELLGTDNRRLRSSSFPRPPFKMTESTLRYLHSKSKLIASLVGVISVAVDDRTDLFASQKSVECLSEDAGTTADDQNVPGFEENSDDELNRPVGDTKDSELLKLQKHVSGYSTVQRYMQAYMRTVLKVTEALQAEPDQSCPELASSKGTGLTWRNTRACVLADMRSKKAQWLFHLTLNHLMSSCKWVECLEFIDALQTPTEETECLGDVPLIRDFVLCCAAQGMPSQQDEDMSVDSWQYLLRVDDKTLAARVVLGSVSSLSVAASLELLHHCHAYPSRDARLSSAIEKKLVKMKIYKKTIEYAIEHPPSLTFELVQESDEFPSQPVPNPYLDWQYVADESQSNPHRILDILMVARDFDLARHWAEVHGVYDSVWQVIQEKYLEHLLKEMHNSLKSFQVLEAICDKTACLTICESLLASSDINLSSSVFLVQYVLDHFLDEISHEKVEELQSISVGAKALLCLPERARSDYQQLISKPNLIVEQLLMNMKVDWAAQVLQCLSQELSSTMFVPEACTVQAFDKLICKYAVEAMYIPKIHLNLSGDLEETLTHSTSVTSLTSLNVMSTTPNQGFRQRIATPTQLSAASPLSSTPLNLTAAVAVPTSKTSAESKDQSPASSFTRSNRVLRRQSSAGELKYLTSPPMLTKKRSVYKVIEETLPSTPPKREDWVPDAKVMQCMVCNDERFSMFNRRHHCRRCGRVVCWRCSQLKAVVEGYGDAPVRVCSECFNTFIMPRSSQQGPEQRLIERLSGALANRSPDSSFRGSPCIGSFPDTPNSNTSAGTTQQYVSLEFQLAADEAYNAIIRQDFYYEQAPSTSLCLSILELHSDPRECGQQILKQCHDLSELLRPIRPGVINPEVDYNLVISMMKTLLFNAKLKFLKDGDSSSVELCDTYLSHVDLLSVFVSSNCADIPSIQQLQKSDSARCQYISQWLLRWLPKRPPVILEAISKATDLRLGILGQVRDRLVKVERLLLAQEVSTKSGLDSAAVWTAWGMSCLRVGDYQEAREKFSRILKAVSDRNQMQPPPKLVADILQYLESPAATTLIMNDILKASRPSIRDFIAEPKIQSTQLNIADSPALQECLYYTTTYCSYSTLVHFYRKHKNFNLAVSIILQKRCSTEVFIECLLVPCMKQGELKQLQDEMVRLDPTLKMWNAYLTAACRYLNRNKLSHVLYHFQLFMKDFVRAAMTCIKFFQSGVKTYSDLFDRLHHLEKARQHFKAVQDDRQWDGVPRPKITGGSSVWASPSADTSIRLMLSPTDLTKHLNTMKLQIEVTKFLHRMAGKGSGLAGQVPASSSSSPSSSVAQKTTPTLFGNSKEKAEVARKVLLCGNFIEEGFQLAFMIIQDFRLPDTLIYSHVGRHLATIRKYKEIRQLLSCVRDTGLSSDQSCDEILDACVRNLADDPGQVKEAETLIKLMKSDTNKINAYILCGKLKSAYLLAVKGERVEDVQRIMRAAKQAGQAQAQMKAICQAWLATQEEKRLREQQAQQLLFQSRQPKH